MRWTLAPAELKFPLPKFSPASVRAAVETAHLAQDAAVQHAKQLSEETAANIEALFEARSGSSQLIYRKAHSLAIIGCRQHQRFFNIFGGGTEQHIRNGKHAPT